MGKKTVNIINSTNICLYIDGSPFLLSFCKRHKIIQSGNCDNVLGGL